MGAMTILRAPVLVAVALAGALLVPASTSAQPARETAGRTHVIADCVHRTVKPRKVIATCGDANVYAVVKRYGSMDTPEKIEADIAALL